MSIKLQSWSKCDKVVRNTETDTASGGVGIEKFYINVLKYYRALYLAAGTMLSPAF